MLSSAPFFLVGKLQVLSVRFSVLHFTFSLLPCFWSSYVLTYRYPVLPSVLSVKPVVISAARSTINDSWVTTLLRFPSVPLRHSLLMFFTLFHPFLLLTNSLFRYRLLHCLGRSHSFQDFRRKINRLLFIPSLPYPQPFIFIHSSIHTLYHRPGMLVNQWAQTLTLFFCNYIEYLIHFLKELSVTYFLDAFLCAFYWSYALLSIPLYPSTRSHPCFSFQLLVYCNAPGMGFPPNSNPKPFLHAMNVPFTPPDTTRCLLTLPRRSFLSILIHTAMDPFSP